MEVGDTVAVTRCLSFAMEAYGTEKLEDADSVVHDALVYLTERKDTRWVWDAWYAANCDTKFYHEMSAERVRQILENLAFLPKVDHHVERIIRCLAERYPEAVWDYFGDRLTRMDEAVDANGDEFEAVPYRLHDLHKVLSRDTGLAVAKGMAWFARDATLFQFRGGRLLGAVFPRDAEAFMSALADLVKEGGEAEADFALAVLSNYNGETFTHVVLKEIVSRFPEDERRRSGVRSCLENTGVVHGELGFANAWRARKEALSEWLEDPRPEIRTFAEKERAGLDLMVAVEVRRAEASNTIRRMEYSSAADQGEDDPVYEVGNGG